MKSRTTLARLSFSLLTLLALSGCLFRRNRAVLEELDPGDQPDKILYEKAVKEIERSRFDIGRLTLQTLINTYPDSEYLAKAKLAIADSYYNEGGISGLTQAEVEYKDFITFFPTAPEAPEAQYKAGLAHYRLMGKPDRDRTEAKLAEAEFKEFLLKYPDSPLMPRVKGRLRQVQEVLARGDYRIARFYFQKGANRAARSRFQEIADRYPSFSRADSALWYLGQTLDRLKLPNEAAPYYGRILTEHPFSPLVPEATERLQAMNLPIPRPTRAMLARAEADAAPRKGRDLLQKIGGMLSSRPDMTTARRGPVRLGGPKPEEQIEVVTSPTTTASGTSLIVQPVSRQALEAGKRIESKGEGSNSGSGEESTSTPQQGQASLEGKGNPASPESQQTAETDTPTKKKGKLRFLKKIVNPF